MVIVRSSVKLSKPREKLRNVIFVDSSARIPHLASQKIVDRVVIYSEVNVALESKLHGIFEQIDKNLFESSFVTNQKRKITGTSDLRIINKLLLVAQSTTNT